MLNRRKLSLIIIIILNVQLLFSQVTFLKTYPQFKDAEGRCAIQLDNGNYVIAGSAKGDSDVENGLLVMLNPQGSVIWSQILNSSVRSRFYQVIHISGEGLFIAGFNDSRIFLANVDLEGNMNDSAHLDRGIAYALLNTSDGHLALAGHSPDSLGQYNRLVMMKLDHQFNINLQKQYYFGEGETFSTGYSMKETSDGGFAIAGSLIYDNSSYYGKILKVHSDGTPVWDYMNWTSEWFSSITIDEDHNIYAISNYIGWSNYVTDIIKLGSNGSEKWFSGGFDGYGRAMCLASDHIFLAGKISGPTHSWITNVRHDPATGEQQVYREYTTNNGCDAFSMIYCQDEGLLLAGKATDEGLLVIKTNATGEVLSVEDLEANNHYKLVISPNPAFRNVTIKPIGVKKNERGELIILNTIGMVCKRELLNNLDDEMKIDLSGLKSGVYLISVRMDERAIVTNKLIIQ